MTKDLLEQYPDICGELMDLEKSGRFPKRREKLSRQKAQIEAFVDSIEDSRVRRIVTLRAMEGLTWQQVAGRMGYRVSLSNARRLYSEEVKKFLEISTF